MIVGFHVTFVSNVSIYNSETLDQLYMKQVDFHAATLAL